MLPKLHSASHAGVELAFDRASAPHPGVTHTAVDGGTGDIDMRTEKVPTAIDRLQKRHDRPQAPAEAQVESWVTAH
jgi:hypothetical protein